LKRTVAGYDDTDEGVRLIIAAVDRNDPRPLWYADWGSDRGSATVNMRRALDKVLKERGPKGYAQFKERLRIIGYDQYGDHTTRIDPPFRLWVNTFQPPLEGKRWYHRFSSLTATAGGFDLKRDVLTGHGPLGALYPTNTTHVQKEGDTMTFLYLVPTGMNDPDQPTWGSWAGRYGRDEQYKDRPYYWANQQDTWQGTTHRDNTLKRWAVHLQNDFRTRLNWCVMPPGLRCLSCSMASKIPRTSAPFSGRRRPLGFTAWCVRRGMRRPSTAWRRYRRHLRHGRRPRHVVGLLGRARRHPRRIGQPVGLFDGRRRGR
jgi:hypothetical protein